jgi:hypothetical protein
MDKKLKFADVAGKGDFIRALDFPTVKTTYIEGRVLNANARHPEQSVPCFEIVVTADVREGHKYTGRNTRCGSIGWVPHEVAFLEGDDRVTKVAFDADDVDTVYVDKAYREANLGPLKLEDCMTLVANANGSAAQELAWKPTATAREHVAIFVATELYQQYLDSQSGDSDHETMYGRED